MPSSEIAEWVANQTIFDTHEHNWSYDQYSNHRPEWRDLLQYLNADLATALGPGFKGELAESETFFRVWDAVRTTGYGRAFSESIRYVAGCEMSRDNLEKIDAAFAAFVEGKSPAEWMRKIMDDANIDRAITDRCWTGQVVQDIVQPDRYPKGYQFALRVDHDRALTVRNAEQIRSLEAELDTTLHTVSALDEAFDAHVAQARDTGALASLKLALAYHRDHEVGPCSYAEADRVYSRILQGEADGLNLRPLWDYLIHRNIQRAESFDLPVQIHMGHLAGVWGDIRKGAPAGFIPLFRQYRKVRFDLFHAGWPTSEMMGGIGKEFPNCWLNLCWVWAMNPHRGEHILHEWLDAVPNNKIFGFGGDAGSIFATYGYAVQARQCITRVLEEKIDRGDYDLETAKLVATRIMHDNAEEFFPEPEGKVGF